MKNKLLIIIGVVAIVILGVVLFYYYSTKQAAVTPSAQVVPPPPTTLSLSPASGNLTIGSITPVEIRFNSGATSVDGVDIFYLHYDPSLFEVQDANPSVDGVQISTGTIFPSYFGNNVDTVNGKISLSGIVGVGGEGFNGSGVLATVNLKALQNGNSSLTFDFTPGSTTDTNAIEHSTAADVLSSADGASFVIGEPGADATVDLKVNNQDGPITVITGQTATLSWTSTNATSCVATNGWTGTKGTSGNETTAALTVATTYVLTCSGTGNPGTDEVIVNVQNSTNPPTVDMRANGTAGSITIQSGGSASITWTSTNATTCQASGHWSGEKPTSGTYSTGKLGSSKQYILTCQGSGGTTADNVRVIVKTSGGGTIPAEPPVVDQPVFNDVPTTPDENLAQPSSEQNTEQTSETSTPEPTQTPPPSESIAKVPTNLEPVTIPPEDTTNKTTLTKNDTIKPWTTWVLYAIIPAMIAGITVYFLLKRKKEKSEVETKEPPINSNL